MANEYYLEHVAFVIGLNEGGVQQSGSTYYLHYDAVEGGSPFEGIGLLQWSMGRSFDILREIYVRSGNNFAGTTPPTEIASAIQNNNRWDSHKWYQKSADTTWVREFLLTDIAKEVAGEKYLHEIQEYLDKLEEQGVSDIRARAFCADISNLYGTGKGTVWGGGYYNSKNATNLDKAYDVTPKTTYTKRKKRTYEYHKSANYDNPAPVKFNVPNTTIPDDDSVAFQDEPTPSLDGNITEITNEVFKRLEQGVATLSGKSWWNDYLNIIPTSGYTTRNTTLFVRQLIDIYGLFRENSDLYEEIADEIEEEREEQKQEEYEEEVEKIPDKPSAIDKVVAKALSYPDGSVVYSMKGKRDMVSSGDCSSYTDLCYQEAGLKLGGWSGAQYDTCKKAGKVLVEGGRSTIPTILTTARTGDLVLMTKTGTKFVAGGASHVGIMVTNSTFRHQSASGGINGKKGFGPTSDPLNQYLNNYVSNYQYFALARPVS